MKVNIDDDKCEIEITQEDVYDYSCSLQPVISKWLKVFKKNCPAVPSGFTEKEWKECINKMIYAFDNAGVSKCDDYENLVRQQRKIDEGLELFGKYFQALWY